MLNGIYSALRANNEIRLDQAVFDREGGFVELRGAIKGAVRRAELWLDDERLGDGLAAALNRQGLQFCLQETLASPPSPDAVLELRVYWGSGGSARTARPLSDRDDNAAIALVLSRHRIIETRRPLTIPKTLEQFRALSPDIEIVDLPVTNAGFEVFLEKTRYEQTHRPYVEKFGDRWRGKALEHYISFEIIKPKAGGTYLDVAADISPSSELLSRVYGAKTAFAQDLNYQAGLHGSKIGSDAAAIPLPSGCLDGVISHNSWEHFEGPSDLLFLAEAARLLRPGGLLCITPLLFSEEVQIVTSPSCWRTKYRNAPNFPVFDPRAVLVIDEAVKQRQIKSFSVDALISDFAKVPALRPRLCVIKRDDDDLEIPAFAIAMEKRG